jgi:NAD(P)-dependent dehydrogenase (short-subunit alcohol dehydrogenase family)
MKKSIFDITNKTILVTGASGGIGKEIATQLSLQNCNLIVTGKTPSKLSSALEDMNGYSIIQDSVLDLTDYEAVSVFVESLPRLDGVVFCSGVAEYTLVKSLTPSRLQKTLDINFNSQVELTRLLFKNKKIKDNSSLVYISSLASQQGIPASSSYAASKAALNAFMKVTASEYALYKIRVNSICPALIQAGVGSKILDLSKGIEQDYPLGLGEPYDVAMAVIFLLSNESRWITGNELVMDGGLTLK